MKARKTLLSTASAASLVFREVFDVILDVAELLSLLIRGTATHHNGKRQ